MGFAQEKLGFQNPPKLFFKQDAENAKDILGKTAHYDPQNQSVTVFVTNRHPKDILRSLAHELVHHVQNLRGDLSPEKCGEMGPGYAQSNPHLREMEREAFERGNLCFRDWSDEYKKQQQEVKFLKESKKMANKLTRNKLKGLIRNVLKEMKLNEQVSYEEDEEGMSLPGQYTAAGALPGDPDPAPRLPSRYLDPEDPGYTAGYSEEDPNVDMRGELSDEAAEKAQQQKRFVRRLGLRNMSRLQKMVGAVETGEYDDQTMLAIKMLQKKLGVTQDGVFGPATMRRLKRMKARRSARKPSLKSIGAALDAGTAELPADAQRDIALQKSLEESNNPFAEGNCGKRDDLDEMGCGGKGKRDDAEKQVLDEKEDENQKCEKCKNCKCPGGGKACDRCKNCKCDEKDSKKKDSKKKSGKGGFPDLTGDNKVTQADILKGRGVKLAEGSKIYTPEQEQTLYESRFNDRNQQIFDKLKKLWTK